MQENYDIQHYVRPGGAVADAIVALAQTLTSQWFTPNVPEDTRRDLLFQDALCLWQGDQLVSFMVFTSWDGCMYITLMGTRLDERGHGWGSILMERLVTIARELGFKQVIAMTVPPESKPAYAPTVRFYEKHGFVLAKHYPDLWESGALESVKTIAEGSL